MTPTAAEALSEQDIRIDQWPICTTEGCRLMLTHIPSGIAVIEETEGSLHVAKARLMDRLRSLLALAAENERLRVVVEELRGQLADWVGRAANDENWRTHLTAERNAAILEITRLREHEAMSNRHNAPGMRDGSFECPTCGDVRGGILGFDCECIAEPSKAAP